MTLTPARARRRLRWTLLHARRIAGRHWVSGLSAAVLAAALAVALTSSSLDAGSPSTAAPAAEAPVEPAPQLPAAASVPHAPARPELHLLVYYLVDSEAARDQLLNAHQSAEYYRADHGIPLLAGVQHEVLVVKDPAEEAAAMVFLNDLWRLAQVEGFALHFVDLR
jgi:hypothetical protein